MSSSPPSLTVSRPRLLQIGLPLFFEMCAGTAVGMVGVAMAARLSDTAGAGLSVGNHLFGLLFMVFRLIGAGVSVVVAQNLGAQNRAEADRVAKAGLAASTWMGGAMGLLAFFQANALLRLLNVPPAVLSLATPLLQALAPVLVLDAWNACMASVMRAHFKSRETLWVTLLMHLTHLALVWPLMHGWGTVPGWGLPGFALALGVSRVLGGTLLMWGWRSALGLRPIAADWWRLRWAQLAPVLHIGVPGAAENLSWEIAFMVSVAAVGLMGATALATQAYVLQFNMWILISAAAVGLTIEMVVGHLVGARQYKNAYWLVQKAQKLALGLSLLISVLMAWQGQRLLGVFTQDPSILSAGGELLWWSVALETGRTFNLIVIAALRATGDARFPLWVGLCSMTVVMAGGSWFLGLHLGWGLTGVWIAYAADEWLRGLVMWHRWLSLGWLRKAQAVHLRTGQQRVALKGSH